MVRVALWLAVTGCVDPLAPGEGDPAALRVLEEGTPDAFGVLAMLNDPSTTLAVLDDDARLDARAATNLIAHRDGPDGRAGTADDDRFDTVAEVDAVSWVGDATLQLLIDFARANGWVPADDALYGVVEGLTLTHAQVDAALRVANTASLEVLDLDVGLDARAARGIVAARPFATIEDVAVVPYVGRAALQDLVAWGLAHPVEVLDAAAAVAALEAASAGLWFTSESDHPLGVWEVASDGAPITVANAREVLADAYVPRPGEPTRQEREAEQTTLAWFFDRYTVPQDWWEPAQHDDAPAWQALRDLFEDQLTEPVVFRFGVRSGADLSGAIDVFVVGRTADGQLVGVRTVSVET